ncbi:protease Do [Denitratisoma sp. DHT3]|uniref:DegQ family serine endoprotease n=1 Tax=Denitratisoma sp. DHT3 TaxID=1981880 RepID=UPI00119833A2|nr:DegQ family serine endoprotease [Denitratisoma sp. DHT3]QDX80415.1 protease Do [Denitratisoma sp. DHT3]
MIKRLMVSFGLACMAFLGTGASAQGRDLPDFTDLVEKQGAAVVNISTTQVIKNHPGSMPFDENDPMFDFLRRFGFPRGTPGMPGTPREFENKGLGSGFIVSAEGYILTNAHVVADADEVVVRLTDRREFKAKVLGSDRRTDVALIKIEASGLPVAKLGDPNKLKVGEWVVAIGSPFGLDNTVTAGIVSAKGRSLPQENYVPFIQTDAAVNPGNSGGPLFNMRGEVVGINSQIYSRSGGYMGLSFAIPIDIAMEVKAQLQAHGRVSRGRIGVVIQDMTRELAESFGLPKTQGALVAKVESGGPAAKAGIEEGDVILKFDGKPVNQSADLPRIVGSTRPGSKAPIQVWRKGATRDLTVAVGEMIDEDKPGAGRGGRQRGKSMEPAVNRLGLLLSEPGAEQRKQLGVAHGVVVEDVRNARSELRPGDVILALIVKGVQTEIKSVEQFNGLLSNLDKTATFTLLVKRGDNQTFLSIRGFGESK